MLAIFLLTVSVFAYQADKFLDLRYTFRPPANDDMPAWTRRGFAIDVGTLIVTLIPFTMMACAFDNSLVNRYGPTPFFFSYLLLLAISVVLLFLLRISYLAALNNWGDPAAPDPGVNQPNPNVNQIAIHEERRYAILSVHWFIIDGLAVLLATGLYFTLTVVGGPLCGVSMHSPALWFTVGFTSIAEIRSVTDFVAAWPFFYHNERTLRPNQLGPILRQVAHSPMEARPT
jgi:hypothetical protein